MAAARTSRQPPAMSSPPSSERDASTRLDGSGMPRRRRQYLGQNGTRWMAPPFSQRERSDHPTSTAGMISHAETAAKTTITSKALTVQAFFGPDSIGSPQIVGPGIDLYPVIRSGRLHAADSYRSTARSTIRLIRVV